MSKLFRCLPNEAFVESAPVGRRTWICENCGKNYSFLYGALDHGNERHEFDRVVVLLRPLDVYLPETDERNGELLALWDLESNQWHLTQGEGSFGDLDSLIEHLYSSLGIEASVIVGIRDRKVFSVDRT